LRRCGWVEEALEGGLRSIYARVLALPGGRLRPLISEQSDITARHEGACQRRSSFALGHWTSVAVLSPKPSALARRSIPELWIRDTLISNPFWRRSRALTALGTAAGSASKNSVGDSGERSWPCPPRRAREGIEKVSRAPFGGGHTCATTPTPWTSGRTVKQDGGMVNSPWAKQLRIARPMRVRKRKGCGEAALQGGNSQSPERGTVSSPPEY